MALTSVIMPKTGAEMEEGRILAWKKKEGESVAKGEVLLEIETDKATMEVEAPASGLLLRRLYGDGDTVPATRLIAVLGEGGEPADELERMVRQGPVAQGPAAEARPAAVEAVAAPVTEAAASGSEARVKVSPLARRLAQEKGIDLASIQGTGPGGRIEKDDVVRALEDKAARAPKVLVPPSVDVLIPLSPMRRAIARRVEKSKRETPDFSVTMAMDMTAALRKKSELLAAGKRVSLNDLIIFAVAQALVSHPDLNAQLEGDSLRRHTEVNIALAVGADDGLYLPVICHANKLAVQEIAAETERLAAKVEKKQITEQDMANGTFTVSNLGMFGVESFTAIIVPPQTGILSVGSLVEQPVRGESGLEWRSTLAATVTVDHRVVDGLAAAKFLRDLKTKLAAL